MLSRTAPVVAASARSFHWKPATYLFTPKETIDMYKSWDAQIDALRSKTGGMHELQPIDWAHWRKVIRTPGLVDQLQKDYESQVFPDHKPTFLAEFNQKIDQMVCMWMNFA